MSKLRIAVSGLAGTYPLGGMFWHYMQFVLGLQKLGHDVLYIEDTARWCYDPQAMTFVESGEANAQFLDQELRNLDESLSKRWHFRDASNAIFGRSFREVRDFCKSADLFMNISASVYMRDEYRQARRLVFIDTDPMYTQACLPDFVAGTIDDKLRTGVETLLQHDVFFTVGENVGRPDCLVPDDLVEWHPTRQPIVLDCFKDHCLSVECRRPMLTTVASWEPKESLTMVRGKLFHGKSVEFAKFQDLPGESPLPLEVALSGEAPTKQLRESGWNIRDGYTVSQTPGRYRDYLRESLGEWSVAKHGYVASRSGWFSDRSAMYLALGVPVIVQSTCNPLPSGAGLLTFTNRHEAITAIDQVATSPQRHAEAALELAASYFDSKVVLDRLLELSQ